MRFLMRSGFILSPENSSWKKLRQIYIAFAPYSLQQYTMNHPSTCDDIVRRVGQRAVSGHVRFSEFFRDFDPLRSGLCNASALKCVLTQLNIHLSSDDLQHLTESYLSPRGSRLSYRVLVQDVEDQASLNSRDDNIPILVEGNPQADTQVSRKQRKRTSWHNGEISVIMMLQAQVYEKRVGFRDHFRDFDHLHKGFITEGKLRCVLTILNFDVTDEEIDEIVRLYGIGNNEIDYKRLCDDVERDLVCARLEVDPSGVPPPPFDLVSAKEGKKAILSPCDLEALRVIEDKIRIRSQQRRICLLPHFRSFDHYNRLVITGNQFVRAMTTLGFEIDLHDLRLLQKKYCVHASSARFSYRDFCSSIEGDL